MPARFPAAQRMTTGACCAVAALALAPASARSAPVTVGKGSHPQIAVDAAGTGYITWIDSTPAADTFRYCKLPAGATRCTATFAFADANQDVEGGYAFLPGGNRVLLLEARGVSPTRAKYLWTSTDGGATFAGPTQIGTFTESGAGIGGGSLYAPPGTLGLPEEAIFTIGELAGVVAPFQATGTTGATTASADLPHHVATSLGLRDTTLLAALSDFGELYWSRYAGPVPATLESLNTVANWSAPELVGPRSAANLDTTLASGPAGIYLGYHVDAGPGEANLLVRQFTGTAWAAPAVVATKTSLHHLYQDAGGHLRTIWKDPAGLRYRSTTDAANRVWSAPQTLDATPGESHAFARVATNAAGTGWAVYAGGPGVRAIPLPPAPPTYTGPSRVVTGVGFGATYRLTVPRNCLSPGQRFRVTLRWRRQRRKGNLFVKIRRTDFFLNSRRLKTDLRAPFIHTYRVLITQPRGSTVTVRARAFIKVKRGKSPKKSIRVKVAVCR